MKTDEMPNTKVHRALLALAAVTRRFLGMAESGHRPWVDFAPGIVFSIVLAQKTYCTSSLVPLSNQAQLRPHRS
jgi:hypothetical protein